MELEIRTEMQGKAYNFNAKPQYNKSYITLAITITNQPLSRFSISSRCGFYDREGRFDSIQGFPTTGEASSIFTHHNDFLPVTIK